jgi:hypothetical protein
MARKQDTPNREEWKAALVEWVKEGDYLRAVVEEVVQQILEAEMEETLGAGKSERTGNRRGYRSGYYQRTLITRACQDRPGGLPGQHLKRSEPPPAFLAYWKRSPVGAFMTVNAHFDGRAIIPDEPLDLRPNQALIVQIEPIEGETGRVGVGMDRRQCG